MKVKMQVPRRVTQAMRRLEEANASEFLSALVRENAEKIQGLLSEEGMLDKVMHEDVNEGTRIGMVLAGLVGLWFAKSAIKVSVPLIVGGDG